MYYTKWRRQKAVFTIYTTIIEFKTLEPHQSQHSQKFNWWYSSLSCRLFLLVLLCSGGIFSDISRRIFIPVYQHGHQILAPKKWNIPLFTQLFCIAGYVSSFSFFLHCKPSYRLWIFYYAASACVTASLRPFDLQVTVCPKNLWIWKFKEASRREVKWHFLPIKNCKKAPLIWATLAIVYEILQSKV